MKNKTETLLYVFIMLAIVFSLVSFSLIVGRMGKIEQAVKASELENQPAKLQLIKIADSSCAECFKTDAIIQSLKRATNVTSESSIEFSSEEAKQLIQRYEIERVPTIVVLGEVNKSSVVKLWNENWKVEMENGTQVSSVYANVVPPYRDTNTNMLRGLVNITRLLDTSCAQCSSLESIITSFRQAGAVISSDINVEYNSPQGRQLIDQFGVREIPAVIIFKDILDYPALAAIWPQLNATEKNGFYALHVLQPPYRDLAESRIVGLVDVIYVNDSSCTNCYNVLIHKVILSQNFGIFLINETTIDINSTEGRALVSMYNITAVPTFVMSPDAKYYTGLMQVWPSVGTNETNGWYVFRNVTVLGGTYKDLKTGKAVVQAG